MSTPAPHADALVAVAADLSLVACGQCSWRTELDALPVDEKTGLPYASKVKTKNDAGQEVSVMHACGHDVHMTSMLGTAKMLTALKDQWSGTLVLIGQPAEEVIDGARSMIRAGLYERFPRPDYVIALHDSADLEAGKVGYTPGYAMASSTSVDIKDSRTRWPWREARNNQRSDRRCGPGRVGPANDRES